MTKLPSLNRIERMNEHNDFQNQAVSDPENQNDFSRQKYRKRAQPAEFPRDHQADSTTEHVAHRIYDCIAAIAKRRRGFAISINHGVRVLHDFPRAFQRQRDYQSPTRRQISLDDETREQQQYSREHEPMQQMRERIRVEKRLRRKRTPGVRGPKKIAALAPPRTALMMKLQSCRREDHNDQQQRPENSL